MASPPIVQNTFGSNPVTTTKAPTTTTAGATWRGTSPWNSVPYPQVSGLMWQGKGQGRFSLIEAVPSTDVRFARGPRMSPKKGTLDVWLVGPASGAQMAVALGPVGGAPDDAFLRIGTAGANDAFFEIKDKDSIVVFAATAATPSPLVENRVYRLQMSWDADAGTAACAIDGALVPGGDFGTDPGGTPWEPGVPLEAHLVKEEWGKAIHLLQISSEYLL